MLDTFLSNNDYDAQRLWRGNGGHHTYRTMVYIIPTEERLRILRFVQSLPDHAELGVGEQKEWRYKVFPENAFGADTLRVVSSDKNVADYRGGYVIGKGIGECKIYIKSPNSNVTRELGVTVRKGRRSW